MKTNNPNRMVLLCLIFIHICGSEVRAQTPMPDLSFNWGIMFGLNALSSTNYDVYSDGVAIGNSQFKNKVGYNVTSFFKINFKHVFLQPELATNIYRQEFSFVLPDENFAGIANKKVALNSYTGNATALLGYYIVENRPYRINVFVGTSFRYTYRTDYKLNDVTKMTDKGAKYGYTGVAGFSISISTVHFDIRYELNLPNSDIEMNEIEGIPETFKNISVRKNENILNFSFGLMF
jgi:hypothetical protein